MSFSQNERGLIERALGHFGRVVRLFLYAGGAILIYEGAKLSPESAIHQIYQQNAITGGLILIAVTGVWGAVSWLRS